MKPGEFEELLRWLVRSFTLTTFGELDQPRPNGKAQLVLSFDDGYRDFVEVVAPILAAYRVRANQNVIPACVESSLPPHTVLARDFIATAPAQLLREVNVDGLPRVDPDRRAASAQKFATALKRLTIREQDGLMSQLRPHIERFDGFRPTPMMTLNDVAEVAAVHEVGAHSYEHATMTAETDEYTRQDVCRCRAYLAAASGYEPSVYAFPNGVARRSQAEIAHEAGFAHVLLTGHTQRGLPPWLHARHLVYGESKAETRFRATFGRSTR